jgi:glucan phosphoethanolaminetransferase (alkaline phosphatase superfamily)
MALTVHDVMAPTRLKQMPFALHALTYICVFMPIFAFGFYYRGELPGGLSEVLLLAIGSAVFVYGFLQATRWSRPLLILLLLVSSVWAIFEHHATYSFLDYLGLLGTDGFIFWTLYFRRDVRDYYARANESVA